MLGILNFRVFVQTLTNNNLNIPEEAEVTRPTRLSSRWPARLPILE
jgi:hypothetical protein